MENLAEVNGTIENPAEAPHVKIKENDEQIVTQKTDASSIGALENAAQIVIPRSPEDFMETLTGKSVNSDHGSASDPGMMVEELTLNNYKSPSSFTGEAHEGPSVKKSLWNNLTRLACDPRGEQRGENADRNLFMPQISMNRSIKHRRQMENSYSKVAEHLVESDNRIALISMQSRQAGGTLRKPVSTSGFPQFMVKNVLKGKGVASKDLHNQLRCRNDAGADTNSMDRSTGKLDEKTLIGGGGQTMVDNRHDEITLRQWLRINHHGLDKPERLQIFKQILKLIDLSNSQGFVLQNQRPSYFLISSSNQVRYVGSFVPKSQIKEPEGMNQDIDFYTGGNLKRKRNWESFNESLFLKRQMLHGGGFVSNSGCEQPTIENLNLEEKWYTSPEELNNSGFSLTSNIYSLGVLFFELFCYFESWEMHSTAMSDLRSRILPPSFLSESPKEAAFCLWLLHPARPNSRDILLSELLSEGQETPDSSFQDHSSSIDEEDTETDLLLHFLLHTKEQKEKQAAELVGDVQRLSSDIEEVEKRYSAKSESLYDANGLMIKPKPVINEERLMKNLDQLENVYFSMRSKIELSESNTTSRSDSDLLKVRNRSYHNQNDIDDLKESNDSLGAFFEGFCKYARYSKFKLCGSLRSVDILNSANVICSLSFDRDEDYFASAGVSKKIKIFEFGALLNDNVDIHYPLIEMSSRSKLSCVCWNNYIKNYLASTDYEGVVQLWDASTGQGFTQYTEHQKRAWSVDFSTVDPTKMASGSDDCSVKLWSINERKCLDTIRNVANVCCVQFSPHSSHLLAFGSADYKIYCLDLRMTRTPWCTLAGHGKTVSFVKFVDSATLASASTDNTLKLWDLNKTSSSGLSTNACSLTLSGHTNEKNFIGLSVSDGYIACGSESNDVYAYYRTLPMPITSHKFGSTDPITGQDTGDDNGQFVSSVCWRHRSNMVVAANSSGSIKLLQMV